LLLSLHIEIASILTICASVLTILLAIGTSILTPIHAGSLRVSLRFGEHRSWHREAQRGSKKLLTITPRKQIGRSDI
jgi:hypothetical protein